MNCCTERLRRHTTVSLQCGHITHVSTLRHSRLSHENHGLVLEHTALFHHTACTLVLALHDGTYKTKLRLIRRLGVRIFLN